MINEKGFKYLTICLAIIYSATFILFFTFNGGVNTTKKPSNDFTRSNESVTSINEETVFNWVQLGIFKEQSSMDLLISELKTLGVDSYSVTKNGLNYLVAGISNDTNSTNNIIKICDENNIEYMLKNKKINDQATIDLYNNQKFQEFMEVVLLD